MHLEKSPKIHRAGILQWQAYRVLEEDLNQVLLTYKLSAPEWKTLGIIFDEQESGIRSLQIASKLGVKPPLVTRILNCLETKKFITVKTLKEDGRVRMVQMTSIGEKVFTKASGGIEEAMQNLLQGTTVQERSVYKKVLLKILENKKVA